MEQIIENKNYTTQTIQRYSGNNINEKENNKKKNKGKKKIILKTDLNKFCYLYDSEKYKFSVVCVDCRHFVKQKIKKDKSAYDSLYTHMVKILTDALEIAKKKYNSTEFIVLVDMKKSSLKQIHKHFIQTLIVILENTFTDNLKYCIVKNAPRLFRVVYALIYPLIDKVTRKKFMFEKNGTLKRVSDEMTSGLV